jgi:putative PIN family toxin of toxin-antitoxin system
VPGLRVVLDTNVLVSGLAYPASTPGRVLSLWHQGALHVILSHYILDELVRILPRLSQNKRTPEEIRTLADSFLFLADIVEPTSTLNPTLRDPADQQVLSTFLVAKADYLITGDKDLLALAADYPILTPADFWLRHA